MKKETFRFSVLLGLASAGCAIPSTSTPVPNAPSALATDVVSVQRHPSVQAGDPAETSAEVANVVFQTVENGASEVPPVLQDPAITPKAAYSEIAAPTESGNKFLPVPEIPPAPSVAWTESQHGVPAAVTLADVESLACQNNPTLLQARSQVQGIVGKAIQAGLWPNPTLIYTAEQIGVSDTPGEFHGGLVRQRIVTAHKLDLSREKYLARSRTAEWVALAQQYRVLNDVRIHYFRTRGRQEIVEIQRELLKNAEDAVVTFREMYNVGQATRAEVHQANIQLQRQRLNLLMAENDFRQSLEELIALTGVDLPPSTLQTPLAGELALIDWDEALYRIIEESPQMAAARAKLDADRITIRREIAEPVPDIIVQGGAGWNFVESETVGMAQVMMEVPVFDWNQGTIRQAEADYARQEGEVRRTEQLLRQQLAQQYRNYLTAVQHVRNYEEVILPEAKLAYDLQLQSYEVDRAPWTEVLTAEQDYLQHRIQYITNLIVWRENEVSIMGFLLHGGLSNPPTPVPPGHIDAVPQPR